MTQKREPSNANFTNLANFCFRSRAAVLTSCRVGASIMLQNRQQGAKRVVIIGDVLFLFGYSEVYFVSWM